MEPCLGGTLFQRVLKHAENNIATNEIEEAIIFRNIIRALDSIHERRYLHCGLKLENIMFVNCDDATVKIIDYGTMIALPTESDKFSSSKLIGTPGYFAPESLQRHEYSVKSDIWQAGCVLYA